MLTRTTLVLQTLVSCSFLFFNLITTGTILANETNVPPSAIEASGTLIGTAEVTDTYCGGCNGAIDITITGGVPPYQYSWSNGMVTEDLDNLCIGVYPVTVTDFNDCTYTAAPFVGTISFFDVVLETQAEVNDYVFNSNFCSNVPGSLRIGTPFSSGPSNITDISGLSFITTIGSNLQIFQNPNLTSLNGLQNINSIGNSISVISNDGLTDLSGLPQLSAINSNLTIDNNGGLTSLSGLDQINSIGGDVYISNNTDLLNLSALSQLTSIDGDLDIRICLAMTSLGGLEQLGIIGGDLILRDNIILNDITALDHTINIGGSLEIFNTNLSTCAVEAICDMLIGGAASSVSNNNAGCNNAAEILAACETLLLSVAVSTEPPSCVESCDGVISVTNVSGGTAPYEYAWSNGGMISQIDNLCADMYMLSITDATGLMFSTTLVLEDPPEIALNLDNISFASQGQDNGAIAVTVTGGTPPFSYAWSINGMVVYNDEDLTGLAAGDYDLVVTDSRGCFAEFGSYTIETIVVGLNELEKKAEVQVFPNPTRDNIQVQFAFSTTAPINYRLWDARGRLMKSGDFMQGGDLSASILLDGFTSGIYFLKMKVGEEFIVKKVLVE